MTKEELLAVKVTTEQMNRIEGEAKKHDVPIPQYVREGLDFYASFDVHFLELIDGVAKKMQLPLITTIENLLRAYMATENVMVETYGTPPKTMQRAFQLDKDGLITGTKLSLLVFDQAKVDAETLKKKLEQSTRTGKPARITTEEGVFLATHSAAV